MAQTPQVTRIGLNRWLLPGTPIDPEQWTTDNEITDYELGKVEDAVTAVQSDVAAVQSDVAAAASRIRFVDFNIPTSAWQASSISAHFDFQATFSTPGTVVGDVSLPIFNVDSSVAAEDAGVTTGSGITGANIVTLLANETPGAPLVGSCIIIRRAP